MRGQRDLFEPGAMDDLFDDAEAGPAHGGNADRVRARLYKVVAEARAAERLPWDRAAVRCWRTACPQMTLWLPDDEAAQLRFTFETEPACRGDA